MTPLKMQNANMLMKAPEGEEGVANLYVRLVKDQEGKTYYVSRWEPTPDELAQLNAGGSVELWCMHHQVPVALKTAPHAEAGS